MEKKIILECGYGSNDCTLTFLSFPYDSDIEIIKDNEGGMKIVLILDLFHKNKRKE